jgi:predicted dehydrogenase
MARPLRLGIIGCGTISEAYFRISKVFRNVEIVACADLVAEVAKARAAQFSVRALKIDELLKDKSIDAVINLTVPASHFDVSLSVLSAGKHAYSEKPFSLTANDAQRLVAEAANRKLKVGGAPDTFLGAGGQTARRLIDKGAIGRVIAGSAHILSHGMEHWHPNPGFFYKPGGGPVFDMGPYYLTTLVNLLGPVRNVVAMAQKGFAERVVTSKPNAGTRIKVTTPTTINAVLAFESGTQITFGASWDIWRHGHINPIELYGSEGSMLVPDPNFFSGIVSYSEKGAEYVEVDSSSGLFGKSNWPWDKPTRANYRMLGVADLADAIARNREPRCSGRLAAHVVEIMEATLVSAADRRFVGIHSTVDRPPPLTAADAKRLVRKSAQG